MLLMTAPYTGPAQAYNVVMTTDSANDSSTPDRLMGIALQTAADCLRAPIALQRWESDKGAQCYGMNSPGTPVSVDREERPPPKGTAMTDMRPTPPTTTDAG